VQLQPEPQLLLVVLAAPLFERKCIIIFIMLVY
jgi:hypothetical protein